MSLPLGSWWGHTLYDPISISVTGGGCALCTINVPLPFPMNPLIPNTLSFDLILILTYVWTIKRRPATAKNQSQTKFVSCKEFDVLCPEFSYRMCLLLPYQLKNNMNFMLRLFLNLSITHLPAEELNELYAAVHI